MAPLHVAVLLLLVALSLWAGAAAATEGVATPAAATDDTATTNEPPQDLRFHVPFAVVNMEALDLEPRDTAPTDLRVRRKLVDTSPACDASTPEDEDDNVAPFPAVQASDRLVAVDGVAISLLPFHEVIDAPVGTTVMLPLFKSKDADGNILTGFARVEIVRAQSVEFQPTTAARAAEIQRWQAKLALAQQRQLQREQDAREQQAAAENDELERLAREQREKDEQFRLEMTPHERVAAKRADGRDFRYEVVFTTRGPIGLNWDLLVTDKTIVSYLEPKLAAESTGVIAPKDQLVQINDVDTTVMAPAEVVQAYIQAVPPRRMVFRCPPRASATTGSTTGANKAVAEPEKTQNWTMVFEAPMILRGWETRLHLATWSLEPHALAGTSVSLVAASPLTGCQALGGDVSSTSSTSRAVITYRGGCSFVEKADKALAGRASALIVVNNVKGLGRFPKKMPDVANVALPVTMIGKLDGELVLSILEYDDAVQFHVQEEDPSVAEALRVPPAPPPKLTNQEMTFRRDPKKAARALTFWYVNTTSARRELAEFHVLPALFGGNITDAPFRVVMAYPQDTACHPQGLGVLATQSVILVKRGGCSFGTKAKSVQTVGGAGMIMINSDESLLPLMGEPKEIAEITIWAASIGLSHGTFIEKRLFENKNLPSLVKVATAPIAGA